MSLNTALSERSDSKCELCGREESIDAYTVAPKTGAKDEDLIVACGICRGQLESPDSLDPNHWRCLNESMWSEVDSVKVVAYRMLSNLSSHDWASDLLNMIYLEEEALEWAQAGLEQEGAVVHKDSNGNILRAGDSVVLIKDLNVKGANFIAKRGTAVRRISLVHDNPEHIEGRVNDQHIVIITKFVKKTS